MYRYVCTVCICLREADPKCGQPANWQLGMHAWPPRSIGFSIPHQVPETPSRTTDTHAPAAMSNDDGRITAPEGGESPNEILGALEALRQRGGFLGTIAGILAPGIGPGVVMFICSALVLLIGLSTVAVLVGYYSVHMLVMIFLAVGLMGSVVWSYSVRRALERDDVRQQENQLPYDEAEENKEEEEEEKEKEADASAAAAGREPSTSGAAAAAAPARRSKSGRAKKAD